MIESKSFATARSRGNYFINVSTYIESHKERLDGSQYVQRIPKFTRQEKTSRRARVRERIIAGEEKLDQHGNGPRHPQVVAPPNVNSASQAQSVGLAVSHDRLQTMERTQNVTQINDSFQNLTPPFQTRRGNHALPVSKPTMPLSSDPPDTFRTRGNQPLFGNQSLPGSSNVLQTQPMPQPQLPLDMLTDEAIQGLSTNQLCPLFKQSYSPPHGGLKTPSEVQISNSGTVPSHAPNNPVLQHPAIPQHIGCSIGLLSQ